MRTLIFDLIVIGSGAGLNVAAEAAARGLKTAVIEKGPLGGTCLNRGCIPSKMVIHSADVAEEIKKAKVFGLNASLKSVNFRTVTNRANNTVDADARSIERSLKSSRNLKLIKGTAKFVGRYTVEVNGEKIKGKKIVIAAGARPNIVPIPGLDHVPYMTSTEALRQTKLPKSMIIIGGGYIGCEMGNFYGALGCKLTVIQRGPLLLSREDKDISKTFTKVWKKKYGTICNCKIKNVEKKGKKIVVVTNHGKFTADKLLVATGVKPNSDLLAVEKTGVKTDKRGFIKVNKYLETNVKNIWALGDIAGVYMFRHSANLEADYVTNNILGNKIAVNYYPMPHAVFTSPQIAGVGLTEQQCIEQKKKYVVGKEYYKNTGMGEALAEEDGFVKFIVDKKTKRILGFHALGPHASVLLHEVLIAMKAGRKALDLIRETVHVHPALNEVVQRAALKVPV